MFTAFKMSLKDFDDNILNFDYYYYYYRGMSTRDEQREIIHESLGKYLSPHGVLNASEIESDWFPSIDADVFLSHSHKDEKSVIAFAGWLKEHGIKAFIDSTVWGYADDLLQQIDNAYCVQSTKPNGGHTYNYNMRNCSTAHVHAILNGALAKMIDRTECLIFLDTPNSLKVSGISSGVTNSCWIYSELLLSRIISKKQPSRNKGRILTESVQDSALTIDYDVDLSHLINLDFLDILRAQGVDHIGTDILDQLYDDKNIYIGM